MEILVAIALLFINGAFALHSTAKDSQATCRVFNGDNADEGQFPYAVFLETDSLSFCSGALIGREWVVTAAHCVIGYATIHVYLGMTYRNIPGVAYSINNDSVVIYPDYKHDTTMDIALINIPTTNISNTISPVPLPRIRNPRSRYSHVYAFISGWSRNGDKEDLAEQLQWTILPTISNGMCNVCVNLPYGNILKHELCASTTGWCTPSNTAACLGDSGSPLVLVYKYRLIGIFSQGSTASCKDGAPLIFTRITDYLKWIKNVTGIWY